MKKYTVNWWCGNLEKETGIKAGEQITVNRIAELIKSEKV